MKKRVTPLFAAMLTLVLILASCTTTGGAAEADAVKTGLGIVPSFTSSKDATADAKGLAQADATYAAVTVGADGKIIKCVIDAYQSKVSFDNTGKITSDLTARVRSKNELRDEYNMRGASPIGKEWNEQAAAFAEYCVGKTAEEITSIAVDESNHPTGEDVRAGTTIAIGDIRAAVVKAVANAQVLGAKASDKLGVAVTVDLAGRSKDAAADAEGVGYAYAYYTAVTVGEDGKITSSVLNASQFQVKFNAEGKITTDLTAVQLDKLELKDGYNMRGASPIGKEWFEQANAFAEYVVGKTPAEISALAVDEGGHPTAEDIRASTTVGITDFQATIAVAAMLAK